MGSLCPVADAPQPAAFIESFFADTPNGLS